jgi:hypothetical protein
VVWQWLADFNGTPRRPHASEIPHPPRRTVPPAPILRARSLTPLMTQTFVLPMVAAAPVPVAPAIEPMATPAVAPIQPAAVVALATAQVAVATPAEIEKVAAVAAAVVPAPAETTPMDGEPLVATAPVDETTEPPVLTVAATLPTITLPAVGSPPAALTAALQSPFAVTANGSQRLPFDLSSVLVSAVDLAGLNETSSDSPKAIAEPIAEPVAAMAPELQAFTADIAEFAATFTLEPAVKAADEAPCRRVSATRDLNEALLTGLTSDPDFQVPATFNPDTLSERQTKTWQDHLFMAITPEGLAKDEWPGTTSMTTLRQTLSTPQTWRSVMDVLAERGITHADLIPTLAVTEARGWVAITKDLTDDTLDLAAFLRDTGLLSIDQVASLISESQAFRECRFDALCQELVGKKMLSLAKAGFLNRLGRLAAWHVVPATTFATAEAG